MCVLWICTDMRKRKRRIKMARSILVGTGLYWELSQGHDVSKRFYQLYEACWDHRLDVLYGATTMQAQQEHYPKTYQDQGYLWYYIRKDDFIDPK